MSSSLSQIFAAIDRNDIAEVSRLVSMGRLSPLPLNFAAMRGRVEIMACLLAAGADIDAVDKLGQSACSVAVCHNQIDSLEFLLARGANVCAPRTQSLLLSAAQRRNARCAMLLIDAGVSFDNVTDVDLMGLLVQLQSVPLLKCLATRNVDVSTLRDNSGGTVLHQVVRNANINVNEDFVCALVRLGRVDVNARDHDGRTPLHWAVLQDRVDLLQILVVDLGANIDQRDAAGRTPLLLSMTWGGRDRCTQMLLTLCTDATLAGRNGYSACHAAVDGRTISNNFLAMLVAVGGDLDQPDSNHSTPRMIAIRLRFHLPTAAEIDVARRAIAKDRFILVRKRALKICVGLQSFRLSALQLCEIMMHALGALGSGVAFHQWWKIATTVKHFRENKIA